MVGNCILLYTPDPEFDYFKFNISAEKDVRKPKHMPGFTIVDSEPKPFF
jgi:hypothetical protein